MAFVALTMSSALPVFAVEPDEILSDSKLEIRARAISSELRCMVCQNQSIDESHAPLARDLRVLVREQLVAGKSDDEIKTYLVERYGAFVLLKPPFEFETLILWLSPLLVFALGGIALFYRVRRQPSRVVVPLSDDEQRNIRELSRKS
jgi:cytochrome c-type biogenesis protein CcmH